MTRNKYGTKYGEIKFSNGWMSLGHVVATRFYKREGAGFSGWVVRSARTGHYSDPRPNREMAVSTLMEMYSAEEDLR